MLVVFVVFNVNQIGILVVVVNFGVLVEFGSGVDDGWVQLVLDGEIENV